MNWSVYFAALLGNSILVCGLVGSDGFSTFTVARDATVLEVCCTV